MIEHVHDFCSLSRPAHQVFRQQRKEFGAAVAFQVLEFGERAVDRRTYRASYAVRVLCRAWSIVVVSGGQAQEWACVVTQT
jgi:hypothetical protein